MLPWIVIFIIAKLMAKYRSKYMKDSKILQNETNYNIIQVKYRLLIIFKLFLRFLKDNRRLSIISYSEYDNYWDSFWSKKNIFREDLTFTVFDKKIPLMTPFLFKKQGIIKILANTIESHNFKSVLEVGSGAGLNLLLLAPLFPNVHFYGLEPTTSGVRVSNQFIRAPPEEFELAYLLGDLKNVTIIKGDILNDETIKEIQNRKFDLVFTCAVLEQLHNYLDIVFNNIFSLSNGYFLFYEEWLEGNYTIEKYNTLVDSDYFRVSWNYLNKFENVELVDRYIPHLQPSWLSYSVVFCKKFQGEI